MTDAGQISEERDFRNVVAFVCFDHSADDDRVVVPDNDLGLGASVTEVRGGVSAEGREPQNAADGRRNVEENLVIAGDGWSDKKRDIRVGLRNGVGNLPRLCVDRGSGNIGDGLPDRDVGLTVV